MVCFAFNNTMLEKVVRYLLNIILNMKVPDSYKSVSFCVTIQNDTIQLSPRCLHSDRTSDPATFNARGHQP